MCIVALLILGAAHIPERQAERAEENVRRICHKNTCLVMEGYSTPSRNHTEVESKKAQLEK